MFPIEVTWNSGSNSSPRRGVWVDTVTVPDKRYTDDTYAHKAVIVDFERNSVHIVNVDCVRTTEGFIGDEGTEVEVEGPSPRPINLYGRRIVTGRPGDIAGETGNG